MNPAPNPVPAAKQTSSKLGLDSKKLRLILGAALVLLALFFVGALIYGSSALSKESQKMVDLKVKSQTAEAQLANLEKAEKQVDKYAFFKGVAKTVIPEDKDQAAAIVEINKMAQEAGISLQSITFPASSLGLNNVAAQDATSTASVPKVISQAKPVTGIPGLYSLELTITPENNANTPPSQQITYAKMLDFLSRIENNRHTAQIADVNIAPAGAQGNLGNGLSFTLTTNIFIKP